MLPVVGRQPAAGRAERMTGENMGSQIDDLTPQRAWKETFLAALADCPNVSAAARLAGVTRQNAYQTRDVDPEFKAAWDDAVETSVDDLEGRVFDATRVIDNPTSAQLAMFLLRAHRASKYSEKLRAEITGKDGGPIEHSDAKATLLHGVVSDPSAG